MQCEGTHAGPVLSSQDGWDVIECEICGFVHLDPIPSESELEALYASATYYHDSPQLDKDEAESDYWDFEHKDKIHAWADLGWKTGRLLDVGCSGGWLLESAQRAGWDVEGIEPSPACADLAVSKGLSVRQSMFQAVDYPPDSFDVIHSRLLFEHLPDPRLFLRWATRILSPEGVLTVEVPNEFNKLQVKAHLALNTPEWWVAPPFHINYFTFDGLENLLRSSGFRPVMRGATFPVEWFLLMGDNYIDDDEVGRTIHDKRMLWETRLEEIGERRPMHEYLAARSLGRHAIVHAKIDR